MRTLLAATTLAMLSISALGHPAKGSHVWIMRRDGTNGEYALVSKTIRLDAQGKQGEVKATDLLSVHMGAVPDAAEGARIQKALEDVSAKDRKTADGAAELLSDIGLPSAYAVVVKLDKTDTDLKEPQPVYRVYERTMPSGADEADRTLDLVRLAGGVRVRGRVLSDSITVRDASGEKQIALKDIRAFAVLRDKVEKTVSLHALRHCTFIDYMDLGIRVQKGSAVKISSDGWVRNAFDQDGWSSDADGLKVPGPNYKTNLYDGFPFGAIVGKVGGTSARFMVGKKYNATAEAEGRFYVGVNDNPHWQNNIGSYRSRVVVENAYDIGEPR